MDHSELSRSCKCHGHNYKATASKLPCLCGDFDISYELIESNDHPTTLSYQEVGEDYGKKLHLVYGRDSTVVFTLPKDAASVKGCGTLALSEGEWREPL